jgi:hypothetical protein
MTYFAYQWSMLTPPQPVKFDEVPRYWDGSNMSGQQKPFLYLIKIPPGYRGLNLDQLAKLYPYPSK